MLQMQHCCNCDGRSIGTAIMSGKCLKISARLIALTDFLNTKPVYPDYSITSLKLNDRIKGEC